MIVPSSDGDYPVSDFTASVYFFHWRFWLAGLVYCMQRTLMPDLHSLAENKARS
ncbi:hypothetical protein ASPTUDRAFT_46413, partial [Aspergillus tubingensis CBS 134.48]